jgi:tRNA(fMet)-specific endonuclease VapC
MHYLLDTNVVIAMMNQAVDKVLLTVEKHRRDQMATSSIVIHELCYGAFKSAATSKNLSAIERLNLRVLDYDRDDALEAGRVRALLASQGRPIGPYDTLIAAQALRHGLVLVTANTREFERVPGLVCEDWSR